MNPSSLIYLCINLPQSQDRRDSIMSQAQKLGLNIQLVTAVHGSDISGHAEDYDSRARLRTHLRDLSPNQQACVLSHKKALAAFLSTDAEYAVILEDDAQLAENIEDALREIIEHLKGWEIVKLFTEKGEKVYSVGDAGGTHVRAVFPKKLLWVSVGFLYTRRGAQRLLDGMRTFSMPADVQIAKVILEQGIPTIAVEPPLVGVPGAHVLKSTINQPQVSAAYALLRRPFGKYLAYRLSVWRFAVQKWFMRQALRLRIRRV